MWVVPPPPPRTLSACGEGEEGVAFDVSQGSRPVLGYVALPGLGFEACVLLVSPVLGHAAL